MHKHDRQNRLSRTTARKTHCIADIGNWGRMAKLRGFCHRRVTCTVNAKTMTDGHFQGQRIVCVAFSFNTVAVYNALRDSRRYGKTAELYFDCRIQD